MAIATSRFGGHSMTTQLREVLMRAPVPTDQPDAWRRFGYQQPMDHALAVAEHAALRQLLTDHGVTVTLAEPPTPGLHDAIFTFDPSIITDGGAVILRMGKPERAAEPELARQTYDALGIPVIGAIEAPGTVEGGDTMWVDGRTLAVGVGYRTNAAGIDQIERVFAAAGLDITVLRVPLPYWNGPDECLHLLSLLSPIDDRLAIAYPKLMPVPFVQELERRGWRLVAIPDDEFATQGCNVLTIRSGLVVMLRPNVVARRRLEAEGITVLTYGGDEISHNRAGGPTCLTRPLLRHA